MSRAYRDLKDRFRRSVSLDRARLPARRAARLVDEAPDTYKHISKVMRAQRQLTSIRRKLQPILSFKGA